MFLAELIEKGDEVEASGLFDALFEAFDFALGDFKAALELGDLSQLFDEFLVVAFAAFEAAADHKVADVKEQEQADDTDDEGQDAITRRLLFEISGDLINLFFKESHDACIPCGIGRFAGVSAVKGAA